MGVGSAFWWRWSLRLPLLKQKVGPFSGRVPGIHMKPLSQKHELPYNMTNNECKVRGRNNSTNLGSQQGYLAEVSGRLQTYLVAQV